MKLETEKIRDKRNWGWRKQRNMKVEEFRSRDI